MILENRGILLKSFDQNVLCGKIDKSVELEMKLYKSLLPVVSGISVTDIRIQR